MRNKLSRRRDRKIFKRTAAKRNVKNFGTVKRGGQCF